MVTQLPPAQEERTCRGSSDERASRRRRQGSGPTVPAQENQRMFRAEGRLNNVGDTKTEPCVLLLRCSGLNVLTFPETDSLLTLIQAPK